MVEIKHKPGQASLPTAHSTKSFWHKEPSEILFGHRTTSTLPTEADVVIIGSGISGASAAHWLREECKDVNIVMLEAREACWGATGRNGGHCQPMLYKNPPDVGAFELRNYEAIKALVWKHSIQCDWKSLSSCHTYMTESMFATAVEQARQLQSLDPDMGRLVSIITKDSSNPSLDDLRVPNAVGAIVQANAASLWPYKLVAWILENLLSSNTASNRTFNLQTTTPVTRLQKLDNGYWIVHTPRGMIASKTVLVTTNGYTSYLLPEFSDLIVPVRGEMSSLLPPKSMRPSGPPHPLNRSYIFIGHGTQQIEQSDYLVQRPFSHSPSAPLSGGELMFGGGRAYAPRGGIGVSDDSSIDNSTAAYLRMELNVVLDLQNQDEELEATWEWSGIMGYSRDERPWVGELSEDLGVGGGKGLWICAGFTGHGMPNTCLSAKAVVELMMGKKVEDIDLPRSYQLNKERIEKARANTKVHI